MYRLNKLTSFTCLSVLSAILIGFPTLLAQSTQPSTTKDSEKTEQIKSEKNSENLYIRVVRDKQKKRGSLETSIRHFVADNGVSVDLVGAIHVAEKSYYQELNEIFSDYDVVLYEVVAEEGTRPGGEDDDEKESSFSVIGFTQRTFADLLGLVHQIEYIDYHAQNMVHADMSPKEFAEAMKARNDGFTAWYLREMGYEIAKGDSDSETSDLKIVTAFFKKNRKRALKDALADQFAQMDSDKAMCGGSDGTSIITDRNNKVLGKLKEILKDDSKKKIAIFYGAAHLPDFSEKLERDFHMKPQDDKTVWIKAWKF